MNKKTYFLACIEREFHVDRTWVLHSFGKPVGVIESDIPYAPNYDGETWFCYDDEGNKQVIEGTTTREPIFPVEESVTFEAKELANIEKKTVTAYSTAMINIYLFIWPFSKPLPYIAEPFDGKRLDSLIEAALDDGTISTAEYTDRFHQACGRLTVFTQIAVAAATPKSILPSKEALRVRDQMLKDNPDKLEDAAFLALVDKAVADADREYLKDDPSAKFFLKPKAYDVVRKKKFHFQGGLPKLDDPSRMDLLPNSLEEGLRPEDMAAAVNSLRSGSYGRAKDTALGGEAAKFANRVFQNTSISSDDCATKVGEPMLISKRHVKELLGRYLIGSKDPLDAAAIEKLIGKQTIVRSPNTCKEPNLNFCRKCIGDRVADSDIGLAPQLNAIGNVFMSVALAAFHGSALKTKPLTLDVAFTDIARKK